MQFIPQKQRSLQVTNLFILIMKNTSGSHFDRPCNVIRNLTRTGKNTKH